MPANTAGNKKRCQKHLNWTHFKNMFTAIAKVGSQTNLKKKWSYSKPATVKQNGVVKRFDKIRTKGRKVQ